MTNKNEIEYPHRVAGLLTWDDDSDDPTCFGHWPAPDITLCEQCALEDDCDDFTFSKMIAK